MTIDTDNLLESIMSSFERIKFIESADIPNIDLYMDQVTTFMDKHLSSTTRNKGEDKVLTKTMINNYAKNNLLPPPEKKKYSKEHIIILIFIYYFKNILSINDIQSLLNPLKDKYFGKDNDFSVTDIYDEIVKNESFEIDKIKENLKDTFKNSRTYFEDKPEDEKDFLQNFVFICMLAFDVYSKKLLIEKMLDDFNKDTKNNSNRDTKK